jgi:hypothetical protein
LLIADTSKPQKRAEKSVSAQSRRIADSRNRRCFIGGSDARIIMGDDEDALLRLWQEKRGEVEPKDLSGNLLVQLGVVTEISIGAGIRPTVAKPLPTSLIALDGGHFGWPRRGHRSCVRGQVHVAMVIFGGNGGRKIYGPASA